MLGKPNLQHLECVARAKSMNGEVDDPDGVDVRDAGAADGGGQDWLGGQARRKRACICLKRKTRIDELAYTLRPVGRKVTQSQACAFRRWRTLCRIARPVTSLGGLGGIPSAQELWSAHPALY